MSIDDLIVYYSTDYIVLLDQNECLVFTLTANPTNSYNRSFADWKQKLIIHRGLQ